MLLASTRPASLPQFTISSLADVRQEMSSSGSETFVRWPHYTLVIENVAASLGQRPADKQLRLYFSGPGQLALAAVPTQATGQVLRFAEEFVGLAGDEQEVMLFNLFHQPDFGRPVVASAEQAPELIARTVSTRKRMRFSKLPP